MDCPLQSLYCHMRISAVFEILWFITLLMYLFDLIPDLIALYLLGIDIFPVVICMQFFGIEYWFLYIAHFRWLWTLCSYVSLMTTTLTTLLTGVSWWLTKSYTSSWWSTKTLTERTQESQGAVTPLRPFGSRKGRCEGRGSFWQCLPLQKLIPFYMLRPFPRRNIYYDFGNQWWFIDLKINAIRIMINRLLHLTVTHFYVWLTDSDNHWQIS